MVRYFNKATKFFLHFMEKDEKSFISSKKLSWLCSGLDWAAYISSITAVYQSCNVFVISEYIWTSLVLVRNYLD